MLLTVTLNPAIDQTLRLDALRLGAVNRVHATHSQAGGKGLNVARLVAARGLEVRASGFLGRDNDELFTRFFAERGLPDDFVRIPGATRTGIKLLEESRRVTTDLNLPGAAPSPEACEALLEGLPALVGAGDWVAVCGSLPPGLPPGYFSRLLHALCETGAQVAVDTSQPALGEAVSAPIHLIKPNEHELGELLGRPLETFAAALAAAREMQARGLPHVVLSLGREGACFPAPDGALHART
ncbi:MAG: 1-phosphofructokinase family hexose kinase, partial [Opitutales bacterium]